MSNSTPARLQRLKDAGYKLTSVRQTVLNVLEQRDGHMTSSQILEAVEQCDASIGRASVFRTLDLLTSLAIIRPTYIDGSQTPTYVLMPDGHHHHFVCVRCGRIIEFEDCGLSELSHTLEAQFNVHMTGHLLEFYGTCVDCEA